MKANRRHLRQRAEQLIKLLELNAPQPIIEMAAGTLIRGVIKAVGPGAFAAVAKSIIHQEKSVAGVCPFCPEERPISPEIAPSGLTWGMCDVCLASARDDDEITELLNAQREDEAAEAASAEEKVDA